MIVKANKFLLKLYMFNLIIIITLWVKLIDVLKHLIKVIQFNQIKFIFYF